MVRIRKGFMVSYVPHMHKRNDQQKKQKVYDNMFADSNDDVLTCVSVTTPHYVPV